MIFLKDSLITLIILGIVIWVMPARSKDRTLEALKGLDSFIDMNNNIR